jgi:hypothetical protein
MQRSMHVTYLLEGSQMGVLQHTTIPLPGESSGYMPLFRRFGPVWAPFKLGVSTEYHALWIDEDAQRHTLHSRITMTNTTT